MYVNTYHVITGRFLAKLDCITWNFRLSWIRSFNPCVIFHGWCDNSRYPSNMNSIQYISYILLLDQTIYSWPVNSHHKGPVTRQMFPFDDVIMAYPLFAYSLAVFGHINWFFCSDPPLLSRNIKNTPFWKIICISSWAQGDNFIINHNPHLHVYTYTCSYYVSKKVFRHYGDVMMGAMASQITSLTIVYSTVYSGADQIKHQSSASLTFVSGNPPVTGGFPSQRASNAEMFPFDDVIMSM